ncbi:MAG: beta-N-acetylhexosaminidase [Thermomicrobiales bacterium]|nr:beta-N-acetylhexosaminidase [Thermomicrobiales bacterium]MCO5217816.1 beta-N-acetylhexosaminidase [Thermomicrobiales bacterium]MCO5223927.1 beta-N-acetylhexosaminidase [Thermomicrobiales bacterium]MCO5227490.1 beta-N-acetylhexosaminidase [Thermomicrobiales bacterium]
MLNVIPAPQQFMAGEGTLTLDATTQIVAELGTESAARWLRDGLARYADIEVGAGLGPVIHLEIKPFEASLPDTIGTRADGDLAERELHSIEITHKNATITGVSAEAVFRGATTLVQLASLNGGVLPVGTIIDAPRLAWRGLSFDVVRCFHPASTVRDVIDLLALYKMNVLHWHLSDTEGWRFEVPGWPKLTEVSGKTARNDREGGYYTTTEFAELVQYAADRFVTVIPEFDSPGHTASVLRAYPELAAAGILETDPAMHYLHPDQPGVPELLQAIYSTLAESTNGARIHIGGDEAIAMTHEDFQQYIQMALPIARNTGKGIVAWQEAARGGLQEGDIMQLWIPDHLIERVRASKNAEIDPDSQEAQWLNSPVGKAFVELFSVADQDVILALEQGASVIISLGTWLYLDTTYPEPSADPAQEEMHAKVGMKSNNYGQGTVADSYNWDPATIAPSLPLERVAGVEAAIWCEFIENRDELFFQLLPRLAGSAEKGWSQNLPWEDHKARLAQQPMLWDAADLPYFKSSVVWDS